MCFCSLFVDSDISYHSAVVKCRFCFTLVCLHLFSVLFVFSECQIIYSADFIGLFRCWVIFVSLYFVFVMRHVQCSRHP